mgnify:CR=1 FL=1
MGSDQLNIVLSYKILYWKFLLILIFPLSILIDLINGYCQMRLGVHIPIGQFYRIAIMLVLLYNIKGVVCRNVIFTYLVAIVFLFSAGMAFWSTINEGSWWGLEITTFVRILYFYLVILFFKVNIIHFPDQLIYSYVVNYGFIIGACILFSFFTGFGVLSYGESYGFGSKSFFKAGNDLSMTLLYAGAITGIYVYKARNLVTIIKLVVILFGCIFVGTRTGIVGALLIAFIIFVYYVFAFTPNTIKSRNRKRIVLLTVMPILVGVTSVIFVYIYNMFDQYTLDRFSLDNILSARDFLIDAGKYHIQQFQGLATFLGEGVSSLYKSVADYNYLSRETRPVEADYYETIGSYGYLFGWIIIIPFIYWALYSIYLFVRYKSYESFLLMFIFLSFIYISYSAGHGLKNTMLPPVYAFAITLLSTHSVKK